MRNDLTDLTLIVDRSGSMHSCRADAEGGVNQFIEEQKKQAGECLLTLVQFNNISETVYSGPIHRISRYALMAVGSTALLDTLGKVIDETGARLSAMPEDQRPGLVVIVVVTDGEENASRFFNRIDIRKKIEQQQNVYSWKFTFLGANQDSFREAGALGIDSGAIANFSVTNSSIALGAASSNVSRMRAGAQGPCGPQGVACCYTDEERKAMQ